MGPFEVSVSAEMEGTVKYHPVYVCVLTLISVKPDREQWELGSLTGAVSSQSVTEEFEGTLGTVGHRANSAMA